MLLLILISKVLTTQPVQAEIRGMATVYGTKENGKHLATCNGRYPRTSRKPCRRCFFDTQQHIAHRRLPLWTKGTICNTRTKLCVKTVVKDRGPYGAIRLCSKGKPPVYRRGKYRFKARRIRWGSKCYWWQAQPGRLHPGFQYRGEFDLTWETGKAIKLRSFDYVVFKYRSRKWQKRRKRKTAPLYSASLGKNSCASSRSMTMSKSYSCPMRNE